MGAQFAKDAADFRKTGDEHEAKAEAQRAHVQELKEAAEKAQHDYEECLKRPLCPDPKGEKDDGGKGDSGKQEIEKAGKKPKGEVSFKNQNLGSEELAEITIPPTPRAPNGTVAWENLGRFILGWLSPHSTFASTSRSETGLLPGVLATGG